MAQLDESGIRARIRQARKETALTQEQLAELLGVHKRTVENYERVRVPDFAMLNKIARVLNRPVEWFLHGDQPDDGATIERIAELRLAVEALDRKLDVMDVPGRLTGIESEIRSLRMAVESFVR